MNLYGFVQPRFRGKDIKVGEPGRPWSRASKRPGFRARWMSPKQRRQERLASKP